jgi:hypothetical protein
MTDLESLRYWLRVIKLRLNQFSRLFEYDLKYQDLYDIICEPEPNSSAFNSFKEMWESLGDKTEFGPSVFTPEYVLQFHLAMMKTLNPRFYDIQRWSSSLLALTINGSFAVVPKWTQCGDLVAGLLLSRTTKMGMIANNPFLILRPIVAEDESLEALLTVKFQQQIRPIVRCKLVGQCEMGTLGVLFEDQSTPECEQYVVQRSHLDTNWKRVMAGSTAGNIIPSSAWSLSIELRTSRISWHTFAIH